MSSCSSACKTIHASPSSFRDHTCDSVGLILSQGGCLTHDREQTFGSELCLMEMSEVEYAHLQQLFQAHLEAQAGPPDGPDARSQPTAVMVKDVTGSAVVSPFTTTTQAIDLSTSNDEHCEVIPVEKTPASYGEVPGFVLARIRGEKSPTEVHAKCSTSSQRRPGSAARVCLEKRFNAMSTDNPRQPDIQSAVLSNFLTLLQQSAEAQEAVMHPQMQKWMKTDRTNPFEVFSPCMGGTVNPDTNMSEQVISHIPHKVEPKHHGLIIPKNLSLSFCPEKIAAKAHYSSGSNSTEEQQLANRDDIYAVATPTAASRNQIKPAKAAPDSAGEPGSSTRKKARPSMSLSQRREKHNSKERERRKRIRVCCDELNTLVPFCDSDSDKVTTLQWTAAFLRYINKTYGDIFKEEFKKAFAEEKGLFLKPIPPSGQDPVNQEMDETLSISLTVEQ